MANINYKNLPNTSTPLNATNLNAMQDTMELNSSSGVYYFKFDSGILVCYAIVDKSNFMSSSTASTTEQNVVWYRSNLATINFPVEFVSTSYVVSITPTTGISNTRIYIPRINSKAKDNVKVQLIGVEDFTSSGAGYTNLTSVDVIAIGRWK